MPQPNDPIDVLTEMAMSLLDDMLPDGQAKSVREIVMAYRAITGKGGPSTAYDFDPTGTNMALEGVVNSIVENGRSMGFNGREQIKLIALTMMCVGIEIEKARTLDRDQTAREQEHQS